MIKELLYLIETTIPIKAVLYFPIGCVLMWFGVHVYRMEYFVIDVFQVGHVYSGDPKAAFAYFFMFIGFIFAVNAYRNYHSWKNVLELLSEARAARRQKILRFIAENNYSS